MSPAFGMVIDAATKQDSAAFLGLMNFTDRVCATAERANTLCPGVKIGDAAPMFNVGTVDFYVTEDALRPSVNLILGGEPLHLRYAARSKSDPNIYYVGLEAPTPKGKGIGPVTDSDLDLTGMTVTLDASAPKPVTAIDLGVNSQSHVVERAGYNYGFENQNILMLDPNY